MTKKIQSNILLATFLIIFSFPFIANAQFSSSSNYQIEAGTVDSLGEYSSSTNFQLFGNIPYIESGNTTSSNFQVISGFPFASSTSAIVVSTPTSSDGGITTGNIIDTPASTTPEQLTIIIKQLNDQLDSLIIQRAAPPSIVTGPDTGLKQEDLDLIGIMFLEPVGLEKINVTEIYRKLVRTRFIPIFIIAIIVILIAFRRKDDDDDV